MTEQEKLLNRIQDTIDDWTNEAIFEYKLDGVIDYETVKKLILFGAHTIAYEVYEDEDDLENHSDPYPDCGTQLESASGGGVKCPNKDCGYWFWY